jgi:dissimilatory sulfite reductase related protein
LSTSRLCGIDGPRSIELAVREARVPTIELNGRTYSVDEDGFLEDPTIWNQEVAQDLATSEGVTAPLTDDQWKVVNYLRHYYMEFGIAPMIRKLCKETGFKLAQIYEMFPSGPAKGACKVAGLPKPTGCV